MIFNVPKNHAPMGKCLEGGDSHTHLYVHIHSKLLWQQQLFYQKLSKAILIRNLFVVEQFIQTDQIIYMKNKSNTSHILHHNMHSNYPPSSIAFTSQLSTSGCECSYEVSQLLISKLCCAYYESVTFYKGNHTLLFGICRFLPQSILGSKTHVVL